jgi:hypothetical protein
MVGNLKIIASGQLKYLKFNQYNKGSVYFQGKYLLNIYYLIFLLHDPGQ